jgi:hypothetical protein
MSIELPSLPVPDGTTDVDTGPVFHQGQYLGRTIREEDAWSKSLVLAYGQQCRKAALLEAAEIVSNTLFVGGRARWRQAAYGALRAKAAALRGDTIC